MSTLNQSNQSKNHEQKRTDPDSCIYHSDACRLPSDHQRHTGRYGQSRLRIRDCGSLQIHALDIEHADIVGAMHDDALLRLLDKMQILITQTSSGQDFLCRATLGGSLSEFMEFPF